MRINWLDIDTVLLDMDGTLLDLHYDNHFWLTHLPHRYANLHDIPFNTARSELTQQIERLRGTLEWYCLDYWSEHLKLDLVALKHETKNNIQHRPYATAFLNFLRKTIKRST